MINLDDIKAIQKLDSGDTYNSILMLGKQCQHAFDETESIQVPESYHKVDKIVMCGMGGSGLGARIIDANYGLKLKHPLVQVHDYDLPTWVDEHTLVICSSFSGTTEETIQNARQAIDRKTKWMAIGGGGDLIKLAVKQKVPYYLINPIYNPSKQPRLAIGYSAIGQIRLVAKAGLIDFENSELKGILQTLKKIIPQTLIEVPVKSNKAKQFAQKFYQKNIILVGSRHMIGSAHTVKNQMNENSKNFCALFDIPELNHHLMEGLSNPVSNQHDMVFWLIESALYPELIQKRFKITTDVINKNKIKSVTTTLESKTQLNQIFEFMQFGCMVNFYLSMQNGIDPVNIPWVDYFKTKLGQSLGSYK